MKKKLLFFICTFFFTATTIFFFWGEGRNYGMIWLPRLAYILVSLLLSIAMLQLGNLVLKIFLPKISFSLLSLLLNFALGTWIICTTILILGSLGWLSPYFVLLMLLLPSGLNWRVWIIWWKNIQNWRVELPKILVLFLCILFVFNMIHAFLPPLDYDVLEYHLGSSSEYLKDNRITFLESNVYSNFPQNLEMLAFLMMILLGKFSGAIAAQIFLQIYGILLIASVYCLSCQILPKSDKLPIAAFLSAVFAYSLPWTAELSRIYYVEIPQTAFLLLGFTVFFATESGTLKQRCFTAGFLFGIAAGFKYTTLFLAAVAFAPLIIYYIVKELSSKRNESRQNNFILEIVKILGIMLISMILAFSPWLIRNGVNTGNPIFPMWNNLIAPTYWSEAMYARFRYAHAPDDGNIFRQIVNTFLISPHTSWIHLFLLPFAFIYLFRKMPMWFIAIIIWLSLWLGFTHRIDRFIYGIWVILCFPMGIFILLAIENFSQKVIKFGAIIFILATIYQHSSLTISGCYDHFLGLVSSEKILAQHHPCYPAEKFLEESQIQDTILVIGEARTFYLDQPLITNTVFDYNHFEILLNKIPEVSQISEYLKSRNIFYLYFHWDEIDRLQKTYQYPYQGKMLPGFWEIENKKLEKFLKLYCERIFLYPQTGKANLEIYRIK